MKQLHLNSSAKLSLLLLLFLSACSNYLELKPDNKLAIPTNLNDLQALLDDSATMNQRAMPSAPDGSSDDYFLLNQNFNSSVEDEQDIYLWQAYQLNYVNDWSLCYQAIYNTNLVLEVLETIERNATNASAWDNVKGSALFYRAFFYSALVSLYGPAYDSATAQNEPGIVLRLHADFNEVSQRSSLQASYNQILKDATESIASLPNLANHVMRPSKCASYALLARVYLQMGSYTNAIAYADKALTLNNYLMDYNNDAFIAGATAAVPFKRYNPEIIFYAEQNTTKFVVSPAKAKVDTVLYASYSSDDMRKTIFFAASAPYQKFKGNYTANATWLFGGLATDELYISRAEAYVMDNQLEKGKEDLDALLIKRYKTGKYLPTVVLEKDILLKKIREERRKELLMRGLRWSDIKRYNRLGAGIELKRLTNSKMYVLAPNDKYYAFPIPKDISVLTGIGQ